MYFLKLWIKLCGSAEGQKKNDVSAEGTNMLKWRLGLGDLFSESLILYLEMENS